MLSIIQLLLADYFLLLLHSLAEVIVLFRALRPWGPVQGC